ncbi:hypothetical protein [uncultured Tateyamaria sp.]|uniref:hypothetical protein n=1 Tax=uncultured Tateyamaria sp. TaxID=455651 RepID=UPI00263381F1|nr:hypothetical protein [uncultured Tateyamaria sp.]
MPASTGEWTVFHPKPGTKKNPKLRWSLPDRAFFGYGACHILAGTYLLDPPRRGFCAERIVPNGPYPGNHIYLTDGAIAFDYRGYVARDRLLDWFRKAWNGHTPGWSGTIEAVRFDLLDTAALNARKMLGPDQYFGDPVARARRFLAQKRHSG